MLDRRPPSLQLVGAGFGRTGTTSLKKALETLGYGACYHMQTAMTRPGHAAFWWRAKTRGDADFRHFLRRYRSAIDWPVCEFHREILRDVPTARVILTIRDADAWYDSMRETLWAIGSVFPWWMQDAVIWNGSFAGRFLERDFAIARYREHVDEVVRSVPPDRLLIFDVRQGWPPLCRFLGVEVPSTPFPRLNNRKFFRKIIAGLRIAEWAVPATLLLAAGYWLLL
jgi:Sulfotransferase domain